MQKQNPDSKEFPLANDALSFRWLKDSSALCYSLWDDNNLYVSKVGEENPIRIGKNLVPEDNTIFCQDNLNNLVFIGTDEKTDSEEPLYKAKIIDLNNPSKPTELVSHKHVVRYIFAIDPTKICTVSWDKSMKIWDIRGSNEVIYSHDFKYKVLAADFINPVLMLAGDKTVSFVNINDFLQDYSIKNLDIGWETQTKSVALAYDLKSAALGSIDGKVVVIDNSKEKQFIPPKSIEKSSLLSSKHTRLSYVPHVEDVEYGPSIYYPVNCLEYCPRKDDLQYLVTGGSEGAIYYFDLVNLRNCKTLKRESSVTHVKFSPDGSYFLHMQQEMTITRVLPSRKNREELLWLTKSNV